MNSAKKLADKGERVPDLAFAGGFSSEDGVFKALALGAPFTKAVCMGRALMIPGMVGKNIKNWMSRRQTALPLSASSVLLRKRSSSTGKMSRISSAPKK